MAQRFIGQSTHQPSPISHQPLAISHGMLSAPNSQQACYTVSHGPKKELMKIRSAVWLYACVFAVLLSVVGASPANAQFGTQFKPQPMNEPASGERYHIEGSVGWWWPSADISISSSQFNLVGTTIDFRT